MRGSPTMVRASFAALLATLPVAIDARGEARRELAKAMDTMKEWWCDDPSTEASAICVDFETVRTAALFGASKAEKGDRGLPSEKRRSVNPNGRPTLTALQRVPTRQARLPGDEELTRMGEWGSHPK